MYGLITKEFLLQKLSQEEIMEHFLGFRVEPGKKYCSPLRKDKEPTCSFTQKNGKLYFVDFSGDFFGDCFDVVQRMYGVNFYKAVDIVAERFGLTNAKIAVEKKPVIYVEKESFKQYREIEITVRHWEASDFAYWDRFKIDEKTLRFFQVFPIKHAFLDGTVTYTYSENDPAYAYRFGHKEYKIYFPFRSHNEMRFMSNTTAIQGLRQIPKQGELLILSKSMKDIMVLRRLGFYAVAFQSESIVPKEEDIDPLLKGYERVISFYDWDRAGIRSANKIRKLYGIEPVFLSDGRFHTYDYKAKDIAEYIERHGVEKTKKLRALWMSYS